MTTKQSQASMDYIESLIGCKLTLGGLLQAIRQAEGISQVEFAKQLEISRQNLCDLEHHRRFVSPKMAAQYAEKLGYSSRQFVRLCLQDWINRDGLDLTVDVKDAA